jgi:hypothetical protein
LNFINKSNATARYLSCGVFAFTNYMGKLRSPLEERNVKGVALKTHQRLRLWKPQAFEKSLSKTFNYLGKAH